MGFRNTLHRFLHWLNALFTYLVYIYNNHKNKCSEDNLKSGNDKQSPSRVISGRGKCTTVRLSCDKLFTPPHFTKCFHNFAPPPHVRMFTLPFGQIVQKTWLEGRHLDNANLKIFAHPRPKPWKLRQTVWKVFGGTRMFPDMLENFWTVWKIYGLPG